VFTNGQRQYLWRAVDQDGDVLDILVQARRDQSAAERFFRKLLKSQGTEPRSLVTDRLRKESERVSVTSSAYDGRRPKPRPDVNRGEDPNRAFLAADDRPNLVGLKLREGKCNYFSIVEPTTRMGCLFEPASDG
jgi:DDE domain